LVKVGNVVDDQTTTEGAPPPPTVEDELLAAAEPPVENSVLQKVVGAGSRLFEKYGVSWKRGPGRSREDGGPKSSDVPLDLPGSTLPANALGGPPVADTPYRSNVVKRCYKTLAKSVTGWADKVVYRKVHELTADKEYATQVVLECAITDNEADAFGDLAAELGAMFGADEKMMALAAGFVTVGAVGGRYVMALRDLNSRLADKRRRNNNQMPEGK
jgi:hypothetical protein